MQLVRTFGLLFSLLGLGSSCRAGTAVFLVTATPPTQEVQRLSLACRFYGLNLAVLEEPASDRLKMVGVLKTRDVHAVIISAAVLPGLNQREVLEALRRNHGPAVPLLITDVTKDTPSDVLEKWSGGAITAARPVLAQLPQEYIFGSVESVGPLRALQIPVRGGANSYLQTAEGGKPELILSVRQQSQDKPFFVCNSVEGNEVFMESDLAPQAALNPEELENPVATFAQLAPEMMFIHFAAGPYGWHATGHYANLTIDDAWLRARYGHLDYAALLNEMEEHHFHTTIAFIPWNFDRSEPGVVSLVRDHPDRFSICVHGNNHDHAEFTDYASKPLSEQIDNIRVGLARMDRFTAKTGIPYDPVMVFPHTIAPLQTLAALKKYNFWATFNSQDVPDGSVLPTDPLFVLRPVTLLFGNFASLKRTSVEGPVSQASISVNAFLDNPQLFYGHEGLFTRGIDAFDPVADFVNQADPRVKWASLGTLAEHLYLARSRDDGGVDVMALSPEISVENPADKEITFYVAKEEDDSAPIQSVNANEAPQAYELIGGSLAFAVRVPAHQSVMISIRYANEFDAAQTDVSKSSWRVNALRWVSDFRDDTLSEIWVGRTVIDFYYRGPHLQAFLVTVLVLLCLTAVYVWRRRLADPRVDR